MVNRRRFGASAMAAVLMPVAARAQQPSKVPRIGYLSLLPFTEPPSPERAAFLAGLAELGYVPGRNLEIIYASAEGVYDFLDEIARDLVHKQPSVIVTSGGLALDSLARATRTIPVVMLAVGDPVGLGLVKSLRRPDTNITGLSFMSSDLAGKRLEIIRELVPRARTVAILFDARNANARLELAAALDAARQLKLAASTYELQNEGAILSARDGAHAAKADLLYAVFEGSIAAPRRFELAEFALRHRRPMVSGWSGITEAGGLISYAPAIVPMFRRAAYYVHRLLQGAKPNDLPVEQPTLFETVVNAATARRLGIKLPESTLLRAGRVIE